MENRHSGCGFFPVQRLFVGAMKKRKSIDYIFPYLVFWLALNLLFLGRFPFMHSDESWLSGLSRAMMTQGPGITEPFFDLLPRYPHAIKILFHTLQMGFIAVFGYGLFPVRLISLLFGAGTLFVFYKLALLLTGKKAGAFAATLLLSIDVQFVYAAHLARQDIVIAFGVLAVLYYVLKNISAWDKKKDIVTGVMLGALIGVHPNSLIASLCAGALYLYFVVDKKLRLRNLLRLMGVTALGAVFFVGISLLLDPGFFSHYARYGSELGVALSLQEKISGLPAYYARLFLGIGSTYYLPPIQMQLVLFGICVAAAVVCAFYRRDVLRLLLPVVAVNAGFILIGRYSQPGIILLFPLCYLLVYYLINLVPWRGIWIPSALYGAAVLLVTVLAVTPCLNSDYEEYLGDIHSLVPSEAHTLANLNADYAFDNGALIDYRNHAYLEQNGMTFEDYIRKNEVEYIVYPEEMDFIYTNRPVFNILYGNLSPYYGDMQRFLAERCSLIGSFTSPYAMRIVQYSQREAWEVRVYRVKEESAG